MNKERPLKVITGYDEVSFGDIVERYPITNHEWRLDSTETEYVMFGNGDVPRFDPWGRRFRSWTVNDEARIRAWDDHSFDPEKLSRTRWTSVEGVPIKLVVI